MDNRLLVAIDTATRTASLALYDDTGVRAETTWWARENHTVSLMPQFERLLELGGVTLDHVGAIGVATGPGSFTGLRIGLSLAKGLAMVRGMSVIGVPTLDGLAQALAWQPLPIWAVLHAGRGRYAAAPYLVRAAQAERAADYLVADGAHLAAAVARRLTETGEPGAVVCGEVDAPLRSALAGLGERVVVPGAALSLRRAAYLAGVAWHRWQAQAASDFDSLVPYYIPTASLPQAAGA